MIDTSRSGLFVGEERSVDIAKKAAMALAELITTRYPKDTLDILVFGNDAGRLLLKIYHTSEGQLFIR
jgi:uncharacterized protein with von Willebrand factor type A (vWA) domain